MILRSSQEVHESPIIPSVGLAGLIDFGGRLRKPHVKDLWLPTTATTKTRDVRINPFLALTSFFG